MKNLGFYNGKIDELENMQVPMLDRACYFGDGVYDASYANNHTIFARSEMCIRDSTYTVCILAGF